MVTVNNVRRRVLSLLFSLIFFISGALPAFAQTGLGTTTSYYSMPSNHVRIDSLVGQNAIFTTTNTQFKRIANWQRLEGGSGALATCPASIVYQGPLTWGSKNRTSSQNASLGEKVVSGSFSLRYSNAATTYDGAKKDVLITVSDVRIFMGARPSNISSNQSVYASIAHLYSGTTEFVNQHVRTSTAASSSIVSSQAVRYKIDTKIVEPGTNTGIGPQYKNVLMQIRDLDVADKTTKSYTYSGRFSEGVGLISGFSSPYLVYANSKVVSQTVDGVQKLRGSSADDGSERSSATLSAAPQGFSYYWYGSLGKGTGGTKGATNMGTSAGWTPTVAVTSSSGEGGHMNYEGITNVGINMVQSYTYEPDPGWVVKSITAGGIPQPVNDENLHGGSFTFQKLTDNNSIRVEFEPPQVNVTKEADKQYYQKGDIVTYTIKLNNKTGIMSVDFVKEQLQALVNDAEPFLEETDKWTEESLQALAAEIEAAKAMLNDPDATIAILQEEMQKLSDAVSGLVEREATAKELLEQIIEEAKTLLNSGVTYTAETRQALEDAIAAGEALTDPTDEQAFTAIADIEEAMDNLRIEGEEDIRDLLVIMAEKMDEASSYLENPDDYTDESIAALQTAYNAADTLQTNYDEDPGSVSNEDVNEATQALTQALSNMETISDAYDAAMTEAEDILNSGTGYTPESLQTLRDVYDGYVADPPTTSEEKKTALTALRTAIDALVPTTASGNSIRPGGASPFSFFSPIKNLFSALAPLEAYAAPAIDYPGTYDTNVVLTEELPDYLQMVGYRVSGGTVEADNNKITFSVDTLGNETYTMTVRAKVIKDVDAPIDVTNTVNVKGDISPNEANADATITVVKPDLAVTKEADKADYHKGDTVHYTIKVENLAANSWANNVVVTDDALSAGQVLKAGTVTCSDEDAVIAEENGTFKVTIPELLGEESETIELDATFNNDEVAAKEVTNLASAVCDQIEDPATGESESTIVYDVNYEWDGDHPDVSVPESAENIPWGDEYEVDTTFKTGDKVKGNVDGQKGSWVFNGWDKTGTIEIKDDLTIKGTWTFVPEYDIVTSVSGGTITPTERDIPQGENRVISYTPDLGYQLKSLTVDGQEMDIKEYPASYTFENIRADHAIHAEFELIPGLEVIKDADKEVYNAGDTVTYTITVRQTVDGAEARDVVLTDTLPAGVTLNKDSFSDNVTVVESSDHSYKISLPTLEDEVTYTYTAVTEKEVDHEELINVAGATGSNVPDGAEDNAKVKSLTPKPEIEKIVSNENPVYGEEITYWIKIKEPQEGIDLRNAHVEDPLPEGVEATYGEIGVDGDEGEAEITENVFKADVPSLKTEAVFSFTAKVTAIEGEIDNIATLTGTDIKALKANAAFKVKEPEPVITKAASKEAASVADTVTYTITASSEIALVDAVLEDKMPEGIEIIEDSVKCSDEKAKISVSEGKIRMEAETLGEAVTITYDAKIAVSGEHINTAELTAFNFPKGPATASAKVLGFKPVPIIEKSVDKDSVEVGEDATYTVRAYTEKGTIYNAVIEDELPKGLSLDEGSITASSGEVSVSGSTITVKDETLSQEPIVITYTAASIKAGEHVNIATITGDNTENDAKAEAVLEAVEIPSPKTGDSIPAIPLAGLAISASALTALLIKRRRNPA